MKTVRIQVLVPADWEQAFRDKAGKQGVTLSTWLAELGKAQLSQRVQAGLSERKGPGQPRKEKRQYHSDEVNRLSPQT